MKKTDLKIDHIPAILWGDKADRIDLFVHGKGGSKEEAEHFAEIVCDKGWQVLSIDLPEHGERVSEKESFDPWNVVPELQSVMLYLNRDGEKSGCGRTVSAHGSVCLLSEKKLLKNACSFPPFLIWGG